jgi:hypothetical protein
MPSIHLPSVCSSIISEGCPLIWLNILWFVCRVLREVITVKVHDSDPMTHVRGYPFSLCEGVECMLSCGMWTTTRWPMSWSGTNTDAVMTLSLGAMLPVTGQTNFYIQFCLIQLCASFRFKNLLTYSACLNHCF